MIERYLIKQVLLEQKEEITEVFKEKIIQRDIFLNIKGMVKSNLIKVIMGVRRCGKSVLAHQLLKGKIYGLKRSPTCLTIKEYKKIVFGT